MSAEELKERKVRYRINKIRRMLVALELELEELVQIRQAKDYGKQLLKGTKP